VTKPATIRLLIKYLKKGPHIHRSLKFFRVKGKGARSFKLMMEPLVSERDVFTIQYMGKSIPDSTINKIINIIILESLDIYSPTAFPTLKSFNCKSEKIKIIKNKT
jgi:hypothetical protein